jgi:hypothetical protein
MGNFPASQASKTQESHGKMRRTGAPLQGAQTFRRRRTRGSQQAPSSIQAYLVYMADLAFKKAKPF